MSLLCKRRREAYARRDLWTVAASELLHSYFLCFFLFFSPLTYLPSFFLCVTFYVCLSCSSVFFFSWFFLFSDVKRSWNSSHLPGSIFLSPLLAFAVVGSYRIPEWVSHSSFRWVIVLLLFCSYALVSHRTSLLIFQYSWAQFSLSSWKRTPIFWARAAH